MSKSNNHSTPLQSSVVTVIVVTLLTLTFTSQGCHKSEDVIRPGHEVTLTVDTIQSLRSKMFLGFNPLWNSTEITFTAEPFLTEQGQRIDWQPRQVKINKDPVNLELPKDNDASGHPMWGNQPVEIVFDLINDSNLVGKDLRGHVVTNLSVAQEKGSPRTISIDKEIKFKVGTSDEIMEFEKSWLSRGVNKALMIMGTVIVIILLLIFAKYFLGK